MEDKHKAAGEGVNQHLLGSVCVDTVRVRVCFGCGVRSYVVLKGVLNPSGQTAQFAEYFNVFSCPNLVFSFAE